MTRTRFLCINVGSPLIASSNSSSSCVMSWFNVLRSLWSACKITKSPGIVLVPLLDGFLSQSQHIVVLSLSRHPFELLLGALSTDGKQ